MTGLAAFVEKHGINRQDLADAAGVSFSHISYLLSGERQPSKERIDSILAFCRTFDADVSYDRLFGLDAEQLESIKYAKRPPAIPADPAPGARNS